MARGHGDMVEAKRLGGLNIYDKRDFRGLLYWQVYWLLRIDHLPTLAMAFSD
jgi:hypothetical protein